MMTVRERLGEGCKRVLMTWSWNPKPLPMAVRNSFALAAAQMRHDLTIAHPPGYELDDELMGEVRRQAAGAGGRIAVEHDIDKAFAGAEVVYAKSWGGKSFYGSPERDISSCSQYLSRGIVDEQKM